MKDLQAVQTSIINFLKSDILKADHPITEKTLLIEEGYLTSLQTLELVEYLEEVHGALIEPEDIHEENFSSVEMMSKLVIRN